MKSSKTLTQHNYFPGHSHRTDDKPSYLLGTMHEERGEITSNAVVVSRAGCSRQPTVVLKENTRTSATPVHNL